LAEWLAVEPQAEIPRNELLLKLFFGEQVPARILIGYVERMANECRSLLETLERGVRAEIDKSRRYPGTPYWRIAAHYGEMEMRAHLDWAEITLAELHKIARIQRRNSKTRKEKSHEN
jgi:hypothetical protein